MPQAAAQNIVAAYFKDLGASMTLFELKLRLAFLLPPEKYDPAEVRLSLPGAAKTFPLSGIDLQWATRPGSQILILTNAPIAREDTKTERMIGLEVAKFLKSEHGQPRAATAEDINRMLEEPRTSRKP